MICLKCGIRFAQGRWNLMSGPMKPPINTEANRKMGIDYRKNDKGICAMCRSLRK